jgi:hypothetical protein
MQARFLAAEEVAEDRCRKATIGYHTGFDCVAEVDKLTVCGHSDVPGIEEGTVHGWEQFERSGMK